MSRNTPDQLRRRAEEELRQANAARARARRRLAGIEREEQAREREREAERERITGRVVRNIYGSWSNPKLIEFLHNNVADPTERELLGLPSVTR